MKWYIESFECKISVVREYTYFYLDYYPLSTTFNHNLKQ